MSGQVLHADVTAANGVIHIISRVLLDPTSDSVRVLEKVCVVWGEGGRPDGLGSALVVVAYRNSQPTSKDPRSILMPAAASASA